MKSGGNPPLFSSHINYFMCDKFFCSFPNIIHLPNPFHLIFRLQLLGNALDFCHVLYQPKE